VLQSSRYLLSLINDILDLSKVEAGKLQYEPSTVFLREILENSMIMIKEKASKNNIVISTDLDGIPETISADERKLKQIIYNLLSNAVKFTGSGGQICLTARLIAFSPGNGSSVSKDQHHIDITVAETGVGIAKKDIDRILNPFEQVESSHSRKFQGTGLGLSLTKNLVEMHGGKLFVKSKGIDQGCIFSFTLPMS
jgi:signal transduction histidine kinase